MGRLRGRRGGTAINGYDVCRRLRAAEDRPPVLMLTAKDGEYDEADVEVYIGYLRRKIDTPFRVRSIETVRGAGYRLAAGGG